MVADEDFTAPQPVLNVAGEFSYVDGAVVGSTRGDRTGSLFNRRDDEGSVVADIARFAFIWRRQYTAWEAFLEEAEARWLDYKRVAGTRVVESIGLRFVNEIPIPSDGIEVTDYLRTSVNVSPYLPQAVSGLFMQVDIPIPSVDVLATVTSSLLSQRSDGTGRPALLLDVDTKTSANLTAEDPEFDSKLRARLDTLRLTKNYVFEACITDATRGLIDDVERD